MLNAGLAYTSYFNNGWGIVHRGNLYHQSDMKNHLSTSQSYNQDLESFSILDISSTLFNDDMYISLFIKNIGIDVEVKATTNIDPATDVTTEKKVELTKNTPEPKIEEKKEIKKSDKTVANERGVTGMFKSEAFGPDPSSGFYGSNDREFIALPRTVGISIDKTF